MNFAAYLCRYKAYYRVQIYMFDLSDLLHFKVGNEWLPYLCLI